jgi:hypothetical protein
VRADCRRDDADRDRTACGPQPSEQIRENEQQRTDSSRGYQRLSGVAARHGTGDEGRYQADEGDCAAHRDTSSDGDGAQGDDFDCQAARAISYRSCDVVAERHNVERAGAAREQSTRDCCRDQSCGSLRKASVDEASHQPFEAVVESER